MIYSKFISFKAFGYTIMQYHYCVFLKYENYILKFIKFSQYFFQHPSNLQYFYYFKFYLFQVIHFEINFEKLILNLYTANLNILKNVY